MDARVVSWYLGPVVLLALVVDLARWLGSRRLDAFASRARRRATLGSVVGALLAYAVVLGGVDRAVASSSDEGATAHPAVPALAAVAGILVGALFERWVPRLPRPGRRTSSSPSSPSVSWLWSWRSAPSCGARLPCRGRTVRLSPSPGTCGWR
jgi:hypothetical protein